MRNTITTFFKGACMGVAEIIPGVSGSTVALVFGIYDDFINFLHSLASLIKSKLVGLLNKFRTEKLTYQAEVVAWKFGLSLILGMIIINLLLANVISSLLQDYPNYIQAFFFGLVLASVFIPLKELKEKNFTTYIYFLTAALVTFAIVSLKPAVLVDIPTPYLFLAGFLGIGGMLLPGISGAFILLLLGVYPYIIEQVKNLTRFSIELSQLFDLVVFGLGILFGFAVLVKVIKSGFKKYPHIILPILSGIIFGSLRALYPFFDVVRAENGKILEKVYTLQFQSTEYNIWLVFAFGILGFLIIQILARFARSSN